MRTDIAWRRHSVVVSRRSNSLCLRYEGSKPSVWLHGAVGKPCHFNNLNSDYPLNLSCFRLRYLHVGGNCCEHWFFTYRFDVGDSHRIVSSALQPSAPSLSYSGAPWCIALHRSCVKHKFCLASDMVSSRVHPACRNPDRNLCSGIRSSRDQNNRLVLSLFTCQSHYNGRSRQ